LQRRARVKGSAPSAYFLAAKQGKIVNMIFFGICSPLHFGLGMLRGRARVPFSSDPFPASSVSEWAAFKRVQEISSHHF
jgi:hypothetical protein